MQILDYTYFSLLYCKVFVSFPPTERKALSLRKFAKEIVWYTSSRQDTDFPALPPGAALADTDV